MQSHLGTLDWLVIASYLAGMLLLAMYLGRGQRSRADYYLGGNELPSWALATSVIATQCSTNSLLGAPAFVGFVAGGGMLWLQYELAVPLAMLALCALFIPIRRSGVTFTLASTQKQRDTCTLSQATGAISGPAMRVEKQPRSSNPA